ncbi:hypothetical protein BOTBODRAFT_384220 [Botryobasidium botryosum FD-172 SS1]|uniref:RTA1 like protein n=1 Tax=Botryobasidium botryosum (strain FD-172 SS1) TaxID=930990 RepID=A0A067MW84_BOTB1|nr:hypothetical protein BOTBODRAFT_384220 [Botryobasidium botryosum FD-172 SS1]
MGNDGNYNYDASKPAALLFFVLFGLTLLVHLFQAIRAKTRYMLPLLVATIAETVGYILRYFSIKTNALGYLIPSEVLVIVAPAFLAAQCYMVVGRMISFVGPGHSIIKHSLLTKIFVACDIVSILTQSGGGSMLSSQDNINQVMLGRKILIAGLAIQVVAFGIFFFVALMFDIKSRRALGREYLKPLRPLFIAFYINAILITGRSIYRTIEFASISFNGTQQNGYATTHEWLFYVFDSVPVLIATVAFNICHPARFLPAKKGLRMDGSYELEEKKGWFGRRKDRTERPNAPNTSEYMA